MGMIAKVLNWTAKTLSGDVECNPGGGANIRAQLANPPGVDAPPLNGDFAVIVRVQGTGRAVQVASIDAIASTAQPGEHRVYARDANGAQVVELHLKGDGSAVLSNDKGSATFGADGSHTLTKGGASVVVAADESLSMLNGSGGVRVAAGGEVTINGVTFSTSGAIDAPSTIKGQGVTDTTTDVTLGTHNHGGPPPEPGT